MREGRSDGPPFSLTLIEAGTRMELPADVGVLQTSSVLIKEY